MDELALEGGDLVAPQALHGEDLLAHQRPPAAEVDAVVGRLVLVPAELYDADTAIDDEVVMPQRVGSLTTSP
ncbi:hypothetical protein WME94_45695 [Sorangium sp. So ce429]